MNRLAGRIGTTLGAVLLVALPLGPVALSTPVGASSSAIGPSGGTVRSADGSITLSVPAGALTKPVAISVANPTSRSWPNSVPATALAGVQLSPSGLHFSKPATLVMRLTGSASTPFFAGGATALPIAFSEDGGVASALQAHTSVFQRSHTVTVSLSVSHFSTIDLGQLAAVDFEPLSVHTKVDGTWNGDVHFTLKGGAKDLAKVDFTDIRYVATGVVDTLLAKGHGDISLSSTAQGADFAAALVNPTPAYICAAEGEGDFGVSFSYLGVGTGPFGWLGGKLSRPQPVTIYHHAICDAEEQATTTTTAKVAVNSHSSCPKGEHPSTLAINGTAVPCSGPGSDACAPTNPAYFYLNQQFTYHGGTWQIGVTGPKMTGKSATLPAGKSFTNMALVALYNNSNRQLYDAGAGSVTLSASGSASFDHVTIVSSALSGLAGAATLTLSGTLSCA